MKILKLVIFLLLGINQIYGQKITDNRIKYKKDCSNCKFILSEASKAYKLNFKEALKENNITHRFAKELIDLDKVHMLKLKAENAFKQNNMNEYYTYFEKLKTISTKYISDFSIRNKGGSYIFIDLGHIVDGSLRYNVYVDSGIKYGNLRIYYNLQTDQLAHIKADDMSYKVFMKTRNKKVENIQIWLFNDYETLAYTMNNETKADKDFVDVCENFIEYKSNITSNNFTLLNSKKVTTTNISLLFKNCK